MHATGTGEVRDRVADWKAAAESSDAPLAVRCLADDVELISPLTAAFRFTGPEQVENVIVAAFEVIQGIRFHTDVGDGATRALFYRARVNGLEIEEAQLLRLNDEGEIRELTLFGRPLPGLTAVMAQIGPLLMRRQGQTHLAPFVGAAVAPLAALTRVGERYLVPLGDPARSIPPQHHRS